MQAAERASEARGGCKGAHGEQGSHGGAGKPGEERLLRWGLARGAAGAGGWRRKECRIAVISAACPYNGGG